MGTCFNRTDSSDAETAELRAKLDMLFQDVRRRAPGLIPTSAIDLKPAFSKSPWILTLVLLYVTHNICAPLFYLSLAKLLVDDDGDNSKSMTMLAPELADGSPFGNMSAAQLLEVISEELGLLDNDLAARMNELEELEEELTSMKKWKKVWSKADLVVAILLAAINAAALVAAKVMPTSVMAMLLASLAAVNLLAAAATKTIGWWFPTDDESKSQLESNRNGLEVMRNELLLPPDLGKIGSLLENLKKERIQMQAANHLEREAEEEKVKKAIKNVRKTVDQVEREVKKAAAKFVVGGNKGGVVAIVEGLRSFVPFSQISSKSTAEELIDKELPLKFVEVDEEQSRLVLSNRKAMADSQAQLGIGSVVLGTVQSLKPYGAFIDIGGINGLLHVSQISHDRVSDISTVLQPGDTLKVMILSHDRERGRVSLSTKKLEPTPGDMIRNPKLVFEKADEMAQIFRQRIAQAEAMARADMLRFQPESGLTLSSEGILGPLTSDLPAEGLDLSDVPLAQE